MTLLADFLPGLPEIFLALASVILLLWGVFSPFGKRMLPLGILVTLLCALALVVIMSHHEQTAFYGLFLSDAFTQFSKVLILAASASVYLMSHRQLEKENVTDFEYGILLLLSTLGMMVMVSANDLISLFVGLELQSLPLYIMIAMQKDKPLASEAAMKYFILGALSTALLLFGASFIYGFAGTTQYEGLAQALSSNQTPIFLHIGLVLIIVALAFKVSLAPFHMWTPDVYQGAPTSMTAFLAAAPKAAAVLLLLRLLHEVFGDQVGVWRAVLMGLSVVSLCVGAFGALLQKDIKRLLAYSSIAHMGFILLGLISATPLGAQNVFVYMAIYLVMVVGTFACVLCLRRHGKFIEDIDDLAGLSREMPLVAAALSVSLFSLAGIPPLAGFMAKFSIFIALVDAGHIFLSVVGVLASVVTAAYYLRVVKVMYFDPPVQATLPLEPRHHMETTVIMLGCVIFMLSYMLYPEILMEPARKASQALLFHPS